VGQRHVRMRREIFERYRFEAAEAYRGLRSAFDFLKNHKYLGKNPGLAEAFYVMDAMPAFSPSSQRC
jgi:hypothetical protein